jgi:hypothetical protein
VAAVDVRDGDGGRGVVVTDAEAQAVFAAVNKVRDAESARWWYMDMDGKYIDSDSSDEQRRRHDIVLAELDAGIVAAWRALGDVLCGDVLVGTSDRGDVPMSVETASYAPKRLARRQ